MTGFHVNVSKVGSEILLTWENEDAEDVEKAREFFIKLAKQGWLAARRNSGFQRILEFEPEYGELWFIPLSEGG